MTVTDTQVLDIVLLAHSEGLTIEGGYREVWDQITEVMGMPVEYNHPRALQIGRVGRKFELLTSETFETVCPDLRDHASSWTSNIK
jgi:L-serine deaminase